MKLTVTGDMADWKAGQVLKRDKDVIAYYRAIVNFDRAKPIDMDDDAILFCVEKIEGDDEDAEIARIELIEAGGVVEETEEQASNVSAIGNAVAQFAVRMASFLGSKSDYGKDVAELADARLTQKKGPAVIALDLSKDFTADQIDGLPEPGSPAKGQVSNNPDRYTETVVVDGVTKKKPASFYSKMCDASKAGHPIKEAIDALDLAIGEKNVPAQFKHYKGMTKEQRTAERAALKSRRDTIKSNTVTAVKVVKLMTTINKMPRCGVRFFMDDKDETKVKNTPVCIVLFDKKADGSVGDARHPLSVGSFLTLKPDVAKAAGGLLSHLIETTGRGTKTTTTGEPAKGYDMDVYDANMGLMWNYAEKVRADDKLRGALYHRMMSKGGEDLLLNTFRLSQWLDSLTAKEDLSKLYAKLEADLAAGTVKDKKAA